MQQHTLLFFKCTSRLKDDSLLASFLEDPRISKTCCLTVALNECRLNGQLQVQHSYGLFPVFCGG